MMTKPAKASWRTALATILATSGLVACDSTQVVEGECRDVYGADVCTWASYTDEGIQELGITFPIAVAENVPEEMQMVWPPAPIAILALPDEAARLTGFSHFELNWEHHGHPPQAFMAPHFDFHFYTIPSDDLSYIDCSDETMPGRLPSGFALPGRTDEEHGPGLCVPSMGMHAMPEVFLQSPDAFTATMLVGYYGGDPIFVEPMITQAKLLERESFALDVPPLSDLGMPGSYPTTFRAEFDEGTRSYRMAFSDFVSR